jgi:formylglycine-generating enzyme required for sulfatase activity
LSVEIAFPATGFAAAYRDMVSVPGGTVTGTGSSGAFQANRTVTISSFQIAKYEVTYQLWKEVYDWATHSDRGANQYTFAHTGSDSANPTRPVGNTSWRDAIVWCNAYSELSGKEPVYTYGGNTIRDSTATTCDSAVMDMTENGYRLPTEAEWEYAARGGGGGGGFTYAGSGTIGDVAVYNASTPSAVGTKNPNGLGLYDMSGNVWEYCWDWYNDISTPEAPTDPTGPANNVGGYGRVRRGGQYDSASYSTSWCEVTYRNPTYTATSTSHSDISEGFRVVCVP